MSPGIAIGTEDHTYLEKQGYLDQGVVTRRGEEILVKASYKSKTRTTRQKLSVIDEPFIAEYRELWPAMKLPNNTMARSSVRDLKERFELFFTRFPELYSWPLVLQSTARYLDEAEQRSYEYTQNSETFIYKFDKFNVMRSTLAQYCQLALEGSLETSLSRAPSLVTIPGL